MRSAAAGLRPRLVLTALVAIVVAAALALTATNGWPSPGGGATGAGSGQQPSATDPGDAGDAGDPGDAAKTFLDTYVEDDGRVVRRDQGSDTVSEGQAYGMLLAVSSRDEARFDRIWSWTTTHLRRPDGLLSWTWANGEIQDQNSASDGDLDAAHALVSAGRVFERRDLTAAGVALGKAVLDRETVATALGRVLVAGQWATVAPQRVNPSYSSPLAYQALADASGDPRWQQVADGDRRLINALLTRSPLPPDWAQVSESGSVTAMPPPGGGAVAFGLDAQRVAVRYAASCGDEDHRLAARLSPPLPTSADAVRGVYDLGGSAQVSWQQPLAMVASAAAAQADGRAPSATTLLEAASALDARGSTYYGAAWAALGPVLLGDRGALGQRCTGPQ